MNPKFFPTVMIVLSILAAIVYACDKDVRHTAYWISSAAIIASVTY